MVPEIKKLIEMVDDYEKYVVSISKTMLEEIVKREKTILELESKLAECIHENTMLREMALMSTKLSPKKRI